MATRCEQSVSDVQRVEATGVPMLLAEAINGCMRALRVNGNVLKQDALLNDGDVLAVDPQPLVGDGEIALLSNGRCLTLRRIYYEDQGVRLEPLDPRCAYTRAKSLDRLDVRGRVVAIIRNVSSRR